MSKTVYFYHLNIFSFEEDVQRIMTNERSKNVLENFINTHLIGQNLDEEASEVAVTLEEVTTTGDAITLDRANPTHIFRNRAENAEIFWEIIQRDENYVFGLLGKNLETYLHLRNTRTGRSRDIVRQQDEQIEATTFFVIDLNRMICAFFKEAGAPLIEEMNNLFVGIPVFQDYQVSMVRMTNQEVIESIARKDIIATLEYEIEIPADNFFRYVGLNLDQIDALQNRGQTTLVVKMNSTGRNASLLQGYDYQTKFQFLYDFSDRLRAIGNSKGNVGAKDTNGTKQEYSFLDDHINLKKVCNINYQHVSRIQRVNPDRPYSDILFEYFRDRLIETLREI